MLMHHIEIANALEGLTMRLYCNDAINADEIVEVQCVGYEPIKIEKANSRYIFNFKQECNVYGYYVTKDDTCMMFHKFNGSPLCISSEGGSITVIL